MKKWVNALADDSLRGWGRWYVQLHISGCNQCRATLEGLRLMRERLQNIRAAAIAAAPPALAPERRAALDVALDAIDRRR